MSSLPVTSVGDVGRARYGLGFSFNQIVTAAILLVLVLLVAFPVTALVYGAFQQGSVTRGTNSFSLMNWSRLFSSPEYLRPLFNTILIFLSCGFISTCLGTFLTWVLNRTDIAYRRTIESLVVVQLLLSPFVNAMAWSALASPRAGLINQIAGGTVVNIYSAGGVIWAMSLYFTPYVYLLVSGAIRGMDSSLEEASQVSGANSFHTLRRVTLPIMIPAISGAALFVGMQSAEMFSIPSVLGSPAGFTNIPFEVNRSINSYPAQWGMAGAMSLLLVMVALVGLYFQSRLTRRSEKFMTVTGKATPSRIQALGRYRPWVTAALMLYLLVSFFLPYVTLIAASFMEYTTFTDPQWTLANYQKLMASSMFLSAIRNTLLLLFTVPFLVLLLGLMTAYVSVRLRRQSRLAPVVGALATMPIALPGIVLGAALLWAYFKIPLPIYGTVLILIIGYCARYLPFANHGFSSRLQQLHGELEEAARTLGASPPAVFRTITLPLLKSAASYSWTIVAINIAKEYGMAIMLFTPGTVTVPVLLYSAITAGDINSAYAAAIVLTVIVGIVVIGGSYLLNVNVMRGARS